MTSINRSKTSLPYKILCAFVAFSFAFTTIVPPNFAQVVNLPVPGTMVPLSAGYVPASIKGLTVNLKNPLEFNFIVDAGDSGLQGEAFRAESTKLVKYFLASLTVPEKDLWVNLSPYEKDRIVPENFGVTEMGRDLLAQDYILKQLSSSLMYPEDELGAEFWDRVYKKAEKLYGTRNIPLNTFNKIWIVPETAVVYQNGATAFVLESRLKVMLEEDYAALQENIGSEKLGLGQVSAQEAGIQSGVMSGVVKDVLIPEIEREVNEGKNFAALRQIYDAVILAKWYKQNLKESLLGQVYVDKNKIKGVDVEDTKAKEKIYEQYVEAFKTGVYNYIKEEYDPVSRETVPRKYFSGGVDLSNAPQGALAVDPATIRTVRVEELTPEQEELLRKTAGTLRDVQVRLAETPEEADALVAASAGQAVIARGQSLSFQSGYQTGIFSPFHDPSITAIHKDIFQKQINLPGEFPYTRHIFSSMAGRTGGRGPVVRKYGSFGTAEEANAILKRQAEQGVTGFSIAFDLPTQNGLDSDHPLAEGEVGKVGVAVDSLQDMRDILEGMPVDQMRTSMTINATAPIVMAMYVAAARERGVPDDQINGTIQNDLLKEFTARGTYVWPYEPTMQFVGDIFEWTAENLPQFNTISISGYHAREKGADEVQEIAFPIADALQYLIAAKNRGLDQDQLAGVAATMTWFLNLKLKTFEEVAKYRALRRIWARIITEGFGLVPSEGMPSDMVKIYNRAATVRVQSWAGGSDVRFAEKGLDNIIRNAIRALNGVASGAQGLDGAAFDEAIGIPTAFSEGLAINRFHVVLEEKGLTEVPDSMGGSYMLEAETDRIEQQVWEELGKIARMDDFKDVLRYMVEDIERKNAANLKGIADGTIPVVGVNTGLDGKEHFPEIERRKMEVESFDAKQKERLARVKEGRDNAEAEKALDELEAALRGSENRMPYILRAVQAEATVGEISDRIRRVYGVSDKEPWNTKPWTDESGKTWTPAQSDSTPEIFDETIRKFLLGQERKSQQGETAVARYREGRRRGAFKASDMPYVAGVKNEEIPGQFPYTRGIAGDVAKPAGFRDVKGVIARENGVSAAQELALSLFASLKFLEVQAPVERARAANEIRFVLSSHDDFYEEIAKFRVARRLWAKLLQGRGIHDENAQQLMIKAVTSPSTLTDEKFWLNIHRASLQAYQAYLGGVQEIEVTPFDAPYGETEFSSLARQMALDTVAIIEKELGLAGVDDPLGGSFYLEAATSRLEAEVLDELRILFEKSEAGETVQTIDVEADSGTLALFNQETNLAPPGFSKPVVDHIVAMVESGRARELAKYTAGLQVKIGKTTKTSGENPKPRMPSPGRRPAGLLTQGGITLDTLAAADETTRRAALAEWFKRGVKEAREVRQLLGVNNQFNPEAGKINGLAAVRLNVSAAQFKAIGQAWRKETAWEESTSQNYYLFETPQGGKLVIFQMAEGEQEGIAGIELGAEDVTEAGDYVHRQKRFPWNREKRLKILVGKPGLDGHDAGAAAIRDILAEAGYDVVYTGIKKTVEEIMAAAKENQADVIGLSILSDAHKTHVPKLARLLQENGLQHVPVILGGVIPDTDQAELYERFGVQHIYTGSDSLQQILTDLQQWEEWNKQEGNISKVDDNLFRFNLPGGKRLDVSFQWSDAPVIFEEKRVSLPEESRMALAAPLRSSPLDISRIPAISNLWSRSESERQQAARHFALAGDLLIEAVMRNPAVAKHIVPASSAVHPHRGHASVASAGLAVTREHFEEIERVFGNPERSAVPAGVGVDEVEIIVTMPDGSERILDILADTVDSERKTITKFIERSGEGIQQVEVWTDDIAAAAKEIVAAAKDRSSGLIKIDEAPREGANGTTVFFVLVTVENNKRVLLELVQRSARESLSFGPSKIAFTTAEEAEEGILKNIFTAEEVRYARSAKTSKAVNLRYAARLAAKQAVLQAVLADPDLKTVVHQVFSGGTNEDIIRLIEVKRRESGEPYVQFNGPLENLGGVDVQISLSHDSEANGAAAIAVVRREAKDARYGIDVATSRSMESLLDDRVALDVFFNPGEIDAVLAKYTDRNTIAYKFAVIHAFKEAAFKAIGRTDLQWKDGFVTELDDGGFMMSVNFSSVNDDSIKLTLLDSSSEDTGEIRVVVSYIPSAAAGRPGASTGLFRRATLTRANYAAHIAKNLKEGAMRIVAETEPAGRRLGTLSRRNNVINKVLNLLEARGVEVRIIDSTLESLYRIAREKADDSSALDPMIKKHEPGFLALTLGKHEVEQLELSRELALSEAAKGVVLINGALFDTPGEEARFTEEQMTLLLEAELLNEAAHADNPSAPSTDAGGEAWIAEMHEEASGLMLQTEQLMQYSDELLSGAEEIIRDKNQVLRIDGKATTIKVVNENLGLKYIYDRYGRVILANGLSPLVIELARRFKDGDLSGEYDARQKTFTQKGIMEALKVLLKTDEDFRKRNLPVIDRAVEDIQARLSRLRQALEDPASVGEVVQLKIELSPAERLQTLPAPAFTESSSSNRIYRSTLAVDGSDAGALEKALESAAEAVLVDLNQEGAQLAEAQKGLKTRLQGDVRKTVLVALNNDDKRWIDHYDFIFSLEGRDPPVQAVVIDPRDMLQVRLLDNELSLIERNKGWKQGSIGIFLRPGQKTDLAAIITSTPRVVGMIVENGRDADFDLAKQNKLIVLSGGDGNYDQKFSRQFDGQITSDAGHVPAIRQSFDPSSRAYIREKIGQADALIQQKADNEAMSEEAAARINRRIEDTLWGALYAVRLGVLDLADKNDLEMYETILKLRQESYYEPGMKREINLLGAENLNDFFDLHTRRHPGQYFKYISRFEETAPGVWKEISVRIPLRDLDDDINKMASHFYERGVRKGDRVSIISPNAVHFYVAFRAITKIGAVAVNMEEGLSAKQISENLLRSGVKAVFFADISRELLERVAAQFPETFANDFKAFVQFNLDDYLPGYPAGQKELGSIAGTAVSGFRAVMEASSPEDPIERYGISVGRDDPAFEQFTSGTTAQPKRVGHTHRGWMSVAASLSQFYKVPPGKEETVFGILPLIHTYGLTSSVIVPLISGANSIILPRRETSEYYAFAARILLAGGVHQVYSTPAIYQGVINEIRSIESGDLERIREKLHDIRIMTSRGSKLPDQLIDFIEEGIGIVPNDGFGSSETPSVSTMPISYYVKGSLGIPGPGTRVRLRGKNAEGEYDLDGPVLRLGNEGLIGFSTDASFRQLGYLGDPDNTAAAIDEDGFVYPGDIFYVRQDGLIEFRTRKGDMLNKGGRNIAPETIEEAVESLAGVKVAAAFAASTDDTSGDDLIYVMVEMEEGQEISEEDVLNHIRKMLAPHEVPERVLFGKVPMGQGLTKKKRNLLAKGTETERRGPADNRIWDVKDTIALMPPAGYHFPGMGQDLYEKYDFIRELYSEATRVLREIIGDAALDLARISFGNQTEKMDEDFLISAVALFTYEVAAAKVFEYRYGIPAYYAGESMGEPAAMTAAGYIAFEDGLRWTYENALYLREVSTKESLRMAVVDGLTEEQLTEALKEQDGQIVIRESDTLFIVSLKIELAKKGESRFAPFIQKMLEINPEAKFHESKVPTAAHDSRMNTADHPEEAGRYRAFLRELQRRFREPRAGVINTLTGEVLPRNNPAAVIGYIERTKYTTIEWKQTLRQATRPREEGGLGLTHVAQLAMAGQTFVLRRQKEEAVIGGNVLISRMGLLPHYDLETKGIGQNFTALPRKVSEFDPERQEALDLRAYAYASGDRNSYHLDPEWAALTPYEGVIAHGTFTESVVLSALQNQFDGYELVGSEVELKAPVRPGDIIRPVFVIDQFIERGPPEEIVVATGALNQNGEIIMEGAARLKKRVTRTETYSSRSRSVSAIQSIVDKTEAGKPEKAGSFKVGDKNEYVIEVTPDRVRVFKYLFSQRRNNPGFAGRDLIMAKAFLSFSSFEFVKGYVHVANQIEEILRPINEGDTLNLRTEITEAEESLVTFSVEAVNQKGETVFKGYVRKMKDEVALRKKEHLTEFEKNVRRVVQLLLDQVIQQIFPSHNRRFAEKGTADNADSLTFDNEDSSRPETQGLAENVLNSVFRSVRYGTSQRKMAVWRYLINISPKKRGEIIAALNNPEVLTAEDFSKAINQDLVGAKAEEKMLFEAAKSPLNAYLSTRGFPNWEYRKELAGVIDTFDFLDKLIWFRPNSIRNSLNPPMFARNMINTMARHGDKFTGIFSPKVDRGEDLETIDRIFTLLEMDEGGDAAGWYVGGLMIQTLLETPHAFVNIDEIAGSTKRLVALIFGLVDYIAATGGKVQSHQFRYQLSAKRQTVQAALREGILSVDGITPALKESEARRDALRSAAMGFATKWSIHVEHTAGISAVKNRFRSGEAVAEKLVERVMSHRGADEFGEKGLFDRQELEQHAREETRILQPIRQMERNREAKYRTPVELSLDQLLAKAEILKAGSIEAVILRGEAATVNADHIAILKELSAKGVYVTYALDPGVLDEAEIAGILDRFEEIVDALLLKGSYGIADIRRLSNVLDQYETQRGKSVNIHLNIESKEHFENIYALTMVGNAGRSRVTTLMYALPEKAAKGSNFAEILNYYRSLPDEFYQQWDPEARRFVERKTAVRDPDNFFLSVPEAPTSPEEAARLDQMAEILPHAYAAGVNVIYRPSTGDSVDAYFTAMDAQLMGYHGMAVDIDHLEEHAGEVMRGMTPERALIEESLRVIKTYYSEGKALGEGAIPFQFTYGIRDVIDPSKPDVTSQTGLVDEATNKIFINILKRAIELDLLTDQEKDDFYTYAFERYYAEGPEIGEIINLRPGEWEFVPGSNYLQIRRQGSRDIVLSVSEERPPVSLIEENVIETGLKMLASGQAEEVLNGAAAIYGQQGTQNMALSVVNILTDNPALGQIVKSPYRVGIIVDGETFASIEQKGRDVLTDDIDQARMIAVDSDEFNREAHLDIMTDLGPGEARNFLRTASRRDGAQRFVHHIKLYTTDAEKALALLKEQAQKDRRVSSILDEEPRQSFNGRKRVRAVFEIGAGRQAMLTLEEADQGLTGATLLPPEPAWKEDVIDPLKENRSVDSRFEPLIKAPQVHQVETLVIGGGGAGMMTAAKLAMSDVPVTILSKVPFEEAHTREAQGGIAANRGIEGDSFDIHFRDTVEGGKFLTDADAVDVLTREAPEVLDEMRGILQEMGWDFDTNEDGSLRLLKFGGHSAPRSHSVADKTGLALHDALYRKLQQIRDSGRPIDLREEYFVTELIKENGRIVGAVAVDQKTNEVHIFQTKAVILATGGAGQIFAYTSNTEDNTGDGYALAARQGVGIQDIEFFQFHPTGFPVRHISEKDQQAVDALITGRPGTLASEKARAEGGYLLNSTVLENPNDPETIQRARFMTKYDRRGELAPRDIVSRGIATEIIEGRGVPSPGETDAKFIYLDLRHIDSHEKLPQVVKLIQEQLGLDPAKDLIPIKPTSHYTMGGIPTDLDGHVMIDADQRRPGYQPGVLPGLYAAGEAANVSVHGANRLGTNSLLELFVFGRRTAVAVEKDIAGRQYVDLPPEIYRLIESRLEETLREKGEEDIALLRQTLRDIMSEKVGVFRNEEILQEALKDIHDIKKRSRHVRISAARDFIKLQELRNMIDVSEMTVVAALERRESRGGHYREDYPDPDDALEAHTVVHLRGEGTPEVGYRDVVRRQKDHRRRRNPMNIVPIDINKDLRQLTGLPDGLSLYLLDAIREDAEPKIVAQAVERIRRFIKNTEADEYVFDLSDPVHPLLKPLAREIVVKVLNTTDFGSKLVTVRINYANGEMEKDFEKVISVVPGKIDSVFSRAATVEDVKEVVGRLEEIHRKRGFSDERKIRNIILLHKPESYANAAGIAKASDLNAALVMSHSVAGDFHISRKLGESLWRKEALRLQRAQALIAAEGAGIPLIDHVITVKMNDEELLRDAAVKARERGASGMRALTPRHAQIFKEVFSQPSQNSRDKILERARTTINEFQRRGWIIPEEVKEHDAAPSEIEEALDVLEQFQQAQLRGDGGMVYDPRGAAEWIDPYSAGHFMHFLDKARELGRFSRPQRGRFERIEAVYGSGWRTEGFVQVSREKIDAEARKLLESLPAYIREKQAEARRLRSEDVSRAEEIERALGELKIFIQQLPEDVLSVEIAGQIVFQLNDARTEQAEAVDQGGGSEKQQNVGGIDLNPAMLNLQIRRDERGIPLPVIEQPVLNMNIEGFLPVIINVAPVTNMPFILGLDGGPDSAPDHAGSTGPRFEAKARFEFDKGV